MPFLAAINAGFTNSRVISVPSSGGGGGSSDTLVENSTFVNAIASASDSNHTYSMASTNISGDFADMRRIATNGTYTIIGDSNINVFHTGAGTTGTNKEVAGAGWIWIVRNSDGAIVKSCNSILNGDHNDSSNIEQQTRGGVSSIGISANIGYSVAINDNYAFTFAGFRLSGSETSENFDDNRAYLFAYDLSDFSLAKVWKVNEFASTIDGYVGAPAYSSFTSGFGEHGMFATNDSLYIPSGYTAHPSNNNYPGGAVSYFDLSDADPSNWTNPTVFKTPLTVNTTTNIGGSNYSNGNFGASGVYVYGTQVLVTHATRVHNYTRSGTSFSETSVYTPTYYVGENYNIPLSNGNVAMVTGDQTSKTLTVRDPANSWSQVWQVTLPGNGFPGYNVLIDAANDKLFTADSSHDGNGTDDGLITVYNADGTVNQTIQNPVSTNTRFGSGFSVHNGKLAAKVRVGGVSTDLAIQFMDVPAYNPGGGSASANGWQANTIITNASNSQANPSFRPRGIAGLSDGGVFVSGYEAADDIGFVKLIDTDGDVQWVKQLNANAYYARFYSASANGTSLFAGGTDFGWGANEAAAGRTNVAASIAAKFAKSDGSVDWMKVIKKTSIGSANDGFDTSLTNTVADSDGNLWILGRHRGSNNETNLHIAKLNGSNGALMSMHKRTKSPDTKQDNIYGIKLDSSGNIYLLWQVYDPNSSNSGVGVQKLNSSFAIQWTKMFSATTYNNDTPYQFVLDSSGNVYVSGTTEQNPGSAFIAKLNTADGTIAWSKQLNTGTNPGTGVDQAKGMVVDNDGNIWLCGPSPGQSYNFILTKYNSSGVIQNQWGLAGGNGYTLYNSINTMDIDGNGNILLGFQMSKTGSARTSIFKLPATLSAGTYTDLEITDRTAVDYAYSPSAITHTTYSMSDVTSDFETADYNSGSYALLPIFSNTYTEDVDPITGGGGGGGGGGSSQWWGTRGMAVGGQQPSNSNIMQYFDITSTGNAQDFGDMTTTDANASAGGNGTRGVRIGGNLNNTTMDYWAFATLGNATDFGDTNTAKALSATVADGTKAITGGASASGYQNSIEYITIDTTGNGTDFGDLLGADGNIAGTNDTTRGIFAGGSQTADVIQYITMATPGNAIDFGDLLGNTANMLTGTVSDNTSGVFQGGVSGGYSNVIQYITIQSAGNSTDFGDLAQARAYGGQTSDATSKRGVTLGGYVNPGSGGVALDSMEYITIDTPGNAADFGDLTGGNERAAGVSGAPGSGGGGSGPAWSGDRGLIGGGETENNGASVNVITYSDITTPGNAQDFGDLTQARENLGALSNQTRGVFCGGNADGARSNVMDYVTVATTGNAQDFGDLTSTKRGTNAASSNGTIGIIAGGVGSGSYPSSYKNEIESITIATTGNATDFGDLTYQVQLATSFADATRGVIAGGYSTAVAGDATMNYITFASAGNAQDFGDLSQGRYLPGSCSDATRGVIAGGSTASANGVNTMDYVTTQTTGNAVDFGDLTQGRTTSGMANATRGVFASGDTNTTFYNVLDYVTIQTTGNAVDFGDNTDTYGKTGACSGSAS